MKLIDIQLVAKHKYNKNIKNNNSIFIKKWLINFTVITLLF